MDLRGIEENGATLYVSDTPSFTKSSGDSMFVSAWCKHMTIELGHEKSENQRWWRKKKTLTARNHCFLDGDKVVMGVESRIHILAAYTIMEPAINNHSY